MYDMTLSSIWLTCRLYVKITGKDFWKGGWLFRTFLISSSTTVVYNSKIIVKIVYPIVICITVVLPQIPWLNYCYCDDDISEYYGFSTSKINVCIVKPWFIFIGLNVIFAFLWAYRRVVYTFYVFSLYCFPAVIASFFFQKLKKLTCHTLNAFDSYLNIFHHLQRKLRIPMWLTLFCMD